MSHARIAPPESADLTGADLSEFFTSADAAHAEVPALASPGFGSAPTATDHHTPKEQTP